MAKTAKANNQDASSEKKAKTTEGFGVEKNPEKSTIPAKPEAAKGEEAPDTPVEEVAKSDTKAGAKVREEKVHKDIDLHQYVTVRNGFQGKLVYKSKHTGEVFIWDEFGDEQDLELKELRDAKSSAKDMFKNNYFLFDDDEIIKYLGVSQYYSNSIKADSFDDLFEMDPDELRKTLRKMPDGQKKAVAYRARELAQNDKIDSLKMIRAIEEALEISLIDA